MNASSHRDASADTQAHGGCLAVGWVSALLSPTARALALGVPLGSPSASPHRAEQCVWCSAQEQHHPALSKAPPTQERTKSLLLRWVHAWDEVSSFHAAEETWGCCPVTLPGATGCTWWA